MSVNEGCVFCRILKGEIPADFVDADDETIVIRDIHPQAPTHLLVIPREHIPSAADVNEPQVWAKLLDKATKVAHTLGLETAGYRLVVNCGDRAGQTVPHLHVHLLSGRLLGWPPG
jgi:histidine triad (HIT) family protein